MKKEEFLLLASMVNSCIKNAFIPECAKPVFDAAISNTVLNGNSCFTFRNMEVTVWKDENDINFTISDLDKKISVFFVIDGNGKNVPHVDIIIH